MSTKLLNHRRVHKALHALGSRRGRTRARALRHLKEYLRHRKAVQKAVKTVQKAVQDPPCRPGEVAQCDLDQMIDQVWRGIQEGSVDVLS